MSLASEQLGRSSVTCANQAIPVLAWVPWTDGQYHQVEAFAGEWTSEAVRLRWHGGPGILYDVWVWAAGVRRVSKLQV